MLYMTGEKFNLFARGTVTCTPTASSISAASNVGDGDPSTPTLFGSLAADSLHRVSGNALLDPGFEDSALALWTNGSLGTGTRASTNTAGEFRTGARAVKLVGTSSANYGSVYQSITVVAGEFRKSTVYIKAPAAGTAKGFLRNLKTGNYYNGTTWASTRAAAVTQAGTGAFVAMTVTYQVEDFDTCRADTVSLRWEIACESGTVVCDDALDVTGVSMAAIFGHNYGPVVPTVSSSDDASAWTTRATMTVKRPSFYSTFAIIYAEYWRIVLVGTNDVIPYTGEAVLGQYQTSATSPMWGLSNSRAIPGVRMVSPSMRAHVYNMATDAPQDTTLSFSARTAAAAKELAEAMWLRSGQGKYAAVVVPIDSETDVFFGRFMEPIAVARPFQGVWEVSLTLKGDPFPTVTA